MAGEFQTEIARDGSRVAAGRHKKDAEIARLRAALKELIKISQRNSDPELMFIAIRMCAQDALGADEQ